LLLKPSPELIDLIQGVIGKAQTLSFGKALAPSQAAAHPNADTASLVHGPLYRVYGRAAVGGVTPSTHAGVPCEVMVIVAAVNPGEVALITVVPA
jgi:hypothetical protein